MKIDGRDTGIKLDLDLNFLLKTGAAALMIWFCGLQWSVNDKLNTMTNELSLIKYQVQEGQKQTEKFITRAEVDNRSKLRDLQLQTIEGRVSALEVRVNTPTPPPKATR